VHRNARARIDRDERDRDGRLAPAFDDDGGRERFVPRLLRADLMLAEVERQWTWQRRRAGALSVDEELDPLIGVDLRRTDERLDRREGALRGLHLFGREEVLSFGEVALDQHAHADVAALAFLTAPPPERNFRATRWPSAT
jgi:hypothetical protein